MNLVNISRTELGHVLHVVIHSLRFKKSLSSAVPKGQIYLHPFRGLDSLLFFFLDLFFLPIVFSSSELHMYVLALMILILLAFIVTYRTGRMLGRVRVDRVVLARSLWSAIFQCFAADSHSQSLSHLIQGK